MTKAERLLNIVTFLRSRRRAVTADVLAERLGVSKRTLYRDIQSLVLSGVPVRGEAGVGYLLDAEATLPPLMFSEAEIEALMLGARLVTAWGDDGMVKAAEEAMTRIRAVLPEETMRRLNRRTTPFLAPGSARRERARHGEAIRRAVAGQRVLAISYVDVEGRGSERHVEPLGLIFWGNAWTLVAWCRLRDDYRLFRLDRIEGLTITDHIFVAEEGRSLQAYIRQYTPDADTQFWPV